MRVLTTVGIILGGAIVLVGCTMAEVPALMPAAARLRAGKADPENGMQEIGPIEAVHGSGCGMFGSQGTYEGATVTLKNQAVEMGADYVQIFTVTEPHSAAGCYDNRFVIRGIAYRGMQLRPSPSIAATRTTSPPAAAGVAPAPVAPPASTAALAVVGAEPTAPTAWPPLPTDCVGGRPATPDDVKAGRAVFATQSDGRPLPVVVPQYAYCVADGAQRPGIIVQAESAFGMAVVGFRPLAGGKSAVAELHGCRLLGQTPPR